MTKDVNFEVVGRLLILLREKSGKEQQEIAKALNVSNAAVSLWESGNGIQTEKIYDLARYYNISVAELISGQLNDENEEDYMQRNYDLKNHPSFNIIDENNYKYLLDYLNRCNNVIKRLFKLYPFYLDNTLNKKENYEFNVLLSNFSIDHDYLDYLHISSPSRSFRSIVEELIAMYDITNSSDLDYELAAIYSLKIDVDPYQVINYSQEASDKYLSLLTQPQKDKLLTKYLVGKEMGDIETSLVIKRLLNSGARCLHYAQEILSPAGSYDSDVLDGLDGTIIEDTKFSDLYEYFKKAESNSARDNSTLNPYSWKRLSKKSYDFLIDKEKTEDIKAISFLRLEKPKLYMDYLESKLKSTY